MRIARYVISIILVLSLFPFIAHTQSTMEFQAGTTIEVQSGADICADNVIINGSYTGSGTKCGGVLPIELATISAQVSKRSVTLTWTTITETNNFGFEVERRKVAKSPSQWSNIGFIKASGTSSTSHTYSYIDKDLQPGKYTYRLKQIDQGGAFKYFESQEVEMLAPDKFSIEQNFPNPFNPTTTIQYALPIRTRVLIAVYNTLGQKVAELVNEEKDAGYYEVQFDASHLASGAYVYRIQAGNFVQTKKFVLLR